MVSRRPLWTHSVNASLALLGLAALLSLSSGCNRATAKRSRRRPPPGSFWIAWSRPIARPTATPTADSSPRLSQAGSRSDVANRRRIGDVRSPQQVRSHCYQAIVICDGKQLYATVADLPGQVLDVPAPAELTREDLFSDEILAGVLTQGLAGESIQLAPLTLDDPLKPILEGAEEPTLLPARDLEGDECQASR